MLILVTGATGFIGSALCRRLLRDGHQVRGAVRPSTRQTSLPAGVETVVIPGIGPDTDWSSALAGVEVVVHLAARVHVMNDVPSEALQAFRLVNSAGTARLARMAQVTGVKRFVFLSSVKVNGEGRQEPYTERDAPAPEDPYGISKWEAEQELQRVSDATGMEIVILRPPLVYGPGVKANLLSLLRVVELGMPLPLASVRNRRSMIYVGNLVDLIARCFCAREAAGRTYLVSDGEDVSTPELIRRMADCLGRPARLFPLPAGLLRLAGRLLGKASSMQRLLGSLSVDSSKVRLELAWKAPFTMEQGLQETARWYLARPG